MKFVRSNNIVGVRDGQAVVQKTDATVENANIAPAAPNKVVSTVEPAQPDIKEQAVVSPVPPVEEAKVEQAPVEPEAPAVSLKERFAIPQFERKVHNRTSGVEYSSAGENKPIVRVLGKDVKSVEAVSEVPAGVSVVDGVEIVGDVAPQVEAQIEQITEEPKVSVPPLPTKGSSAVPPVHTAEAPKSASDEVSSAPNIIDDVHISADVNSAVGIMREPEVVPLPFVTPTPAKTVDEQKESAEVKSGEATSADIKSTAEMAWNKFIDCVIIPTLNTCFDKAKEYVSTVLAEDLKKSNPDA